MRNIIAVCLLCVAVAGCVGPLTNSPGAGTEPKGDGTPNPPIPAPQLLERVEANTNTAGTKGKGYGGGLVTEPVRQYFRIQDKVILDSINYKLRLYQAEKGRYPESFEKFMEEIVRPLGKKLPDLPQGHKYVFDSKQGKLLVERPAR